MFFMVWCVLLKRWFRTTLALHRLALCFSGARRISFKRKENDRRNRLGKRTGRKSYSPSINRKMNLGQRGLWTAARTLVNKWRLSWSRLSVLTWESAPQSVLSPTENPGTGFQVSLQTHCSGPTGLGLKGPGLNGLGPGFLIRLIGRLPAR